MASIGQVWDRTTEVLGDHLPRLMPVAGTGVFVPMCVMNLIALFWATATPASRMLISIAFVALYVVVFWAYLALTAVSLDATRGRAAWGIGGRRLLPALGVYLLLIAGVVALSLPIGVLMAMAGITPEAMRTGATATVSRGLAWTSLIYTLAFCIVVIIAAARLFPLTGVLVAERRGVGALARAWRLTRGMTWRLIGVLILYVVVMQVAGLAAQTVFGSVLRLAFGGEGALTIPAVVTGIVVAAVQAGFSVLGVDFAAKLYATLAGSEPQAPVVAADGVAHP